MTTETFFTRNVLHTLCLRLNNNPPECKIKCYSACAGSVPFRSVYRSVFGGSQMYGYEVYGEKSILARKTQVAGGLARFAWRRSYSPGSVVGRFARQWLGELSEVNINRGAEGPGRRVAQSGPRGRPLDLSLVGGVRGHHVSQPWAQGARWSDCVGAA